MATFLYRCPRTSFNVQGYLPDEDIDDVQSFRPVTCIACRAIHFVNPTTGQTSRDDVQADQ